MPLSHFPLDSHTCSLKLGSYSFDTTKMSFETKEFGYSYKPGNTLPLNFDIRTFQLITCNGHRTWKTIFFAGLQALSDPMRSYGLLGNFSVAGFEVVVSRQSGGVLAQFHLPAVILVFASCFSFLLGVEARPVLLGLLLLAQLQLAAVPGPRPAATTALHIWNISCLLFIAAPLAQSGGLQLALALHSSYTCYTVGNKTN